MAIVVSYIILVQVGLNKYHATSHRYDTIIHSGIWTQLSLYQCVTQKKNGVSTLVCATRLQTVLDSVMPTQCAICSQ